MVDAPSLQEWQTKYEEWKGFAVPLFKEGKAKDAMAQYPWFTTQGEPFTKLNKPISQARVGLITTGGYSIEGEQEAMRAYPTFGNEIPQVRQIPVDVDRSKLRIDHPGYDHKYAEEDVNSNLPLDRLAELVEEGAIGSLSENTVMLMGLQPNVTPVIEETIPEIVSAFKADEVDLALLIPSWPVCHQTVSLVARGLEAEGIATSLVSVMPGLSSPARPPRQVIRRLNIGATVGRPHDVSGQRETLTKMLGLVESGESHGVVDKEEKKEN